MRRENDAHEPQAAAFARRIARSNVATARKVYERQAVAAELAVNSLAALASRIGGDPRDARGRDGLRDLALKLLVAADTNLRAGFDCADRLTELSSPREFVTAQVQFVGEQSERSLRQTIELQRMAFDLLQRTTSARPA